MAEQTPPLRQTVPGGPNPNYERHDLPSAVLWFLEDETNPRQVSTAHPLPVSGMAAVIAAIQALQNAPVVASAPVLYRSALTAIDVAAAPTLGTTALVAGGSLATSAMNNKVVGRTSLGRTTATPGVARTPAGGNLAIRIPITIQTGITDWDIYLSTDADPKFVGRISEAQRAAGCVITVAATATVPATVTAGGTPGAVDVNVAGTLAQAAVTAAQNWAWLVPADTPVACLGKPFVDFDLRLYNTVGDTSATLPTLTVCGLLEDTLDANWYMTEPFTPVFGGQAANVFPGGRRQVYQVATNGRAHAHCIILALGPLAAGWTLDMRAIAH